MSQHHFYQQGGTPYPYTQNNDQHQVPHGGYDNRQGQPPHNSQHPATQSSGYTASTPMYLQQQQHHHHQINSPEISSGTGSGHHSTHASSYAQYTPLNSYSQHQPSQYYLPPKATNLSNWAYYPPTADPKYTAPPSPLPYQASPMPSYILPLASPNTSASTESAPNLYAGPQRPSIPARPHYAPPPSPNYLTPTVSATNTYSPSQSYGTLQPYGTAVNPTYPSATPVLHPTNSTHLQNPATTPQQNAFPNIELSKLNLNMSNDKQAQHWATCDGCGSHPLRGNRWRCFICTDYDLCEACRANNIHSHHRFELIPSECEMHHDACCDGCSGENKDRLLLGPRYKCLKHANEDWCQRCKDAGKACGGPYEVIQQTELGMQIERDRCLPIPAEWLQYLRPAVATYSVEGRNPSTSWFSMSPIQEWFDAPLRQRLKTPMKAKYKTVLQEVVGKLGRDGKCIHDIFSVAAVGTEKKIYTYLERVDMKTNTNTCETLTAYKGSSTSPLFLQDGNSNSLSFQDPTTGKEYRWISNRYMSTLNNERYDFQRNALFQHHVDGSKTLVADWTWHDGDSAPEHCLTIRGPNISHGLVITSLTILHDHHWDIIHKEYARDPEGLIKTQAIARLTPLGMKSYWHATDSGNAAESEGNMGKTGWSKEQKMGLATNVLKGAGVGLKIAAAIVGASGGQ